MASFLFYSALGKIVAPLLAIKLELIDTNKHVSGSGLRKLVRGNGIWS